MWALMTAILACSTDGPVAPSPTSGPTPGPQSPPDPPAPSSSTPEPPGNVLVVVLDDVGVDKIGSYGFNPDAPSTPVLDALAAEGLRFTQAWAQPLCSPTRGSLLTGRHPRRFGIGDAIFDGESVLLPLTEVTIPEMLRAAPHAWSSSAVGKWHLAGTRAADYLDHPLAQGFDWAAGSPTNLPLDTVEGAVTHYLDWEKNTNGVLARSSVYATTDTADDAIARLEAMPEPWFLYVAFNAGHLPLHVPPAALLSAPIDASATDPEKFAAMVEAADRELGRVLAAMAPVVRERTTVFVVGDNGTSRHTLDPAFESGHHKGTVYDAGVRVPLVVAGRGVEVVGTTDALVGVADLFPTIAELAGAPLPPGVALDGRSIAAVLADPGAVSPHETLYAENFEPDGFGPYDVDDRAIRDARYKLVRRLNRDDELFLLDPLSPDEGADLRLAPLDEEAEAAYERLDRALEAVTSALVQ